MGRTKGCKAGGAPYIKSKGRVSVRLVHIRASNDADVECLVRELSVYAPKRSRRTVLIELEERSQTDLLALLTAVETCLSANDIRTVRVAIDGKRYLMTPKATR